jgi:lipopolysaccharide export system permease protein
MRLLSRYLLRELAAPFFFALGALTSMLLLNQIAKRFPDLVGKGLTADVISEVLLLSLPFIIALTLPMAVLVAVLYGFSHLAADNELTAMRAGGISVFQMLRPVFLAGVAVAVTNFLFVDQVLPRSNARLRNLQMDIARKKPTFTMREQAINPVPPTEYFIRASRIEPATGRMRDVTIYDLSLPTARRIVYADSGTMAFEATGEDMQVLLRSGVVHEYRYDEPGTVRVTNYTSNIIRARNVANELERSGTQFERGDREMSTCEMIDRRDVSARGARRALDMREHYTRNDLRAMLRIDPADGYFPEPEVRRHCGRWRDLERWLGRYIFPEPAEAQDAPAPVPVGSDSAAAVAATAQAAPPAVALSGPSQMAEARENQSFMVRDANKFAVEIHKKFTISVACFNFVLIGIALALRFPRGGMGLVLGGSLLIFTIFYISMTGGEQLADRGYLPPAVAMWAPNILIGTIGLLGLRAASRSAGTTRGGDLADLRDVLFGWLRRERA